jgi:hypothetical protein
MEYTMTILYAKNTVLSRGCGSQIAIELLHHLSTPEGQLHDRAEDAFAEDEEHVFKRRYLDDASY